MTTQKIMDANPYMETNNLYNNVTVPYYNNQPMNQIYYKSDRYSINATLSNTGLVCGLAATAVGVGIGCYLYKKYFK